ncbi:histone-lysine N-methyltransferase SETMAR [Plakobranchus ocellatus]|uniref:Histone-lysine N-methyltransferase SETMAR n=1 Tax=Plakobranchus ocellatus TaxID=259542 RepID=A0AAV4A9J1_9GAST|nr:histone-lysine N-methyltransferase SETMAR [Plakobranchus ocellatus]
MSKRITPFASRYCSTLDRLKEAIRRKRPGLLRRGVVLQHDNASPHSANLTQQWLQRYVTAGAATANAAAIAANVSATSSAVAGAVVAASAVAIAAAATTTITSTMHWWHLNPGASDRERDKPLCTLVLSLSPPLTPVPVTVESRLVQAQSRLRTQSD